jgi:hypothetical protein
MASTRELADRLLGGNLRDRLVVEVSEGYSLQAIADGLAIDGVDVSRETVRRWCKFYGLTKPGKETA